MATEDSSVDPLWQEFHQVEADTAAETEAAYQVIEGYNATMLNQIAGIEDARYVLQERLSDGPSDKIPGEELVLKPTESLLFLRPDTRDTLHAQGEPPETIHEKGDPYVITGEVPERTKKLLKDLMASIEARVDKERSAPGEEAYVGNVAGQPIRLVLSHNTMHAYLQDSEVRKPVLSARIYREEPTMSESIGQTVVKAAAQAGITDDDQLDALQQSSSKAFDEAMKKVTHKRWYQRFGRHKP